MWKKREREQIGNKGTNREQQGTRARQDSLGRREGIEREGRKKSREI